MTTQLSATQFQDTVVKTFATMALAIADENLEEGDVLLIKDRANSHWDVVLSSGVTENGYNIVQGVGVGTLSFVLRINDVVNVKALGAVGDGSTDDTLPIQHAFTLGRSVYVPKGTYKLTDDIDPRALGWASGRNFFGDGRYMSSLYFYGCSGVFMDHEESAIFDIGIFGAELTNGYTGTAATDRLLITANTFGLKMGRSHMSAYNIHIRGFDKGFYPLSRYYKEVRSIRTLYNNYSFYADDADAARAQFDHFHSCEFTAGYKANLYIDGTSVGWDFKNCSFEGCTDYDSDGANYPLGGIYVASDASANFENCWVEGANVFLDGTCNVAAGNWRPTVCRKPQNITRILREKASRNLVDPIWYPSPSWQDASATITKAPTQLDDEKRYVILSSTQGAGSSKNFYSDYNDLVAGLEYVPATLDGWHYVGMWVQFKTADITMFDLQLLITDSNGTEYAADTHPPLYPADYPDLTAVDDWQFVGYFAPIKSSNITAYPLTKIRLRLRYGLSAADYSGSARVMWLADPVVKLFTPDGHPIHDVNPQQRVSTINVSNPPTDAELDAAFGTPAQVGKNFNILINDNNSDANVYMVRSNGTSWWYTTLTKAV